MAQVLEKDPKEWGIGADRTSLGELAEPSDVLRSSTESTIEDIETTSKKIDAVLRRVREVTDAGDGERNLGVLVRLEAAWMEGLDSTEVAEALRFSQSQYKNVVHGDMKVQRSKAEHLEAVAQVLRSLLRVLEPEAVGQWFRTPVPALKGKTPLETLKRGDRAAVLRVVEGYLDPSYG